MISSQGLMVRCGKRSRATKYRHLLLYYLAITIARTAQQPPKRILIGTSPSLSIWGMSPQGPRGLGMSTITALESPVKEDMTVFSYVERISPSLNYRWNYRKGLSVL